MKRSTLALRLIQAGNKTQRKKLIAGNTAIADAALARELKEYCYRVWTSQPAETRNAAAALEVLSEVSRDPEIRALSNWVEGIADITNGKLESAEKHLDAASRQLAKLDREHESAQPLVARLIALAMLGRYQAAQRSGEKALEIFRRHRDQLAAGKIEMNLSNIVSRRDQYRLAEKYCLSAYRRFKKLGERTWQTMAENGLANTYAELNDFKRAEEFYERALGSARRARMSVTVAEIEASMGNLALFRGHYADAIRLLESSRTRYEKLGMPHQSAIADLEIADVYGELNLLSEAVEIYRHVIPTLRHLKMRAEEARARANYGRSLMLTESLSAARKELRHAADLFEREENPTASAAVRLSLASLEKTRGNLPGALTIVKSAAAALVESDNVRLRLSALWLRAEILSRLGQYREAENHLTKVLRESRRFEQPSIAQAAMNSLGVVARANGDSRRAEAFFESSIDAVESARAPLPGEEFRMAFLAKSLEPYENLSRLYLDNGDTEKAFASVERGRSRSLLESVTDVRRTRKNDSSLKLRDELNRLYSRLESADVSEIADLQKQISDREKKLAGSSLRAQSSVRSRAARTSGAVDLRSLQKLLGDGNALIEFVERDKNFSVFVVTNKAIEYVENVGNETEVMSLLEDLHFQFGALRFGSSSISAFAVQLKVRVDRYLERLYDLLFRHIADMIGERSAIVVPAGVLNYVPFQSLFDGEKYVIESREVTYSPSAAVWAGLRSTGTRSLQSALVMAHADERIPLVNHEAEQIAKLLRQSTKLTGRNATFEAFQKNASSFDLIHLACHGQFRPDNPMFSSLHLADGWVTVRDLYPIRLKARLVTLSACETGLNKIHAGDEILGLARGFLSAGAKAIVLSLWTVNDEGTSRLMQEFYSNLQRGADVAASLRIAQKSFIARGEHPYYWSPFFVIG